MRSRWTALRRFSTALTYARASLTCSAAWTAFTDVSEPSEPFGGQDLAHGGLGASLPLGDDRLGESEVVVRDDPLVQRIGVLVDVPHAHFYAPIALLSSFSAALTIPRPPIYRRLSA